MTSSEEPSGTPWSWPDDPEQQLRTDLADHLEQAARAVREDRATVHRSATSTTTGGPSRLDVDLSWTPPGEPG